MLVGRQTKEPLDIRRATVDFSRWLDSGETITGFTTPVVTNILYLSGIPYDAVATPPPDPNPLVVDSSFVIGSGTQVQLFMSQGSPGYAYQIQFVATGTSTRQQAIELQMTVVGPPNAVVQ
jgi:hypothetical protein